ncbi:class I adenylate-forming enzyme family protein [Hydrogenophaga sp.]|uniref:class I adenylate-forming enzyme family protein n=1 Tax=Hydrogenophaga sp. TaxID=1904254 RepID=UPI0026393F8F|nr:class I adenylate-forming enzyme family protein [Hydrogenophaga sp.]MCW5653329.1 acyl--CoA ligase [Hydrogenophaga sp.]
MIFQQEALPRRRESHFGNRVVWCFQDRPRSVLQALQAMAEQHAQRDALVFEAQRWRFAELLAEIRHCAAGLKAHGVQPGDRVVLLVGNRPEFVFLFYAVLWLGAVAVPVDVRLKAPEVLHVLRNAGASCLLHDAALADRVPPTSGRPGPLVTIALPASTGLPVFPQAHADAAPPAHEPASEEDVAVILYTSGSTGKPKGAAITHLNMVHSVLHHCGNLDLHEQDRVAIAVPLSHTTGLMCGVVSPLVVGAALLLAPRFKAAEFLPMAARERMTYTIMVPAMYNLCLMEPDFEQHDLSAWRVGHFGGAPMPTAVAQRLAAACPGLRLVNGYGSTETCGAAVMTPREAGNAHLDAVGKPLSCIEVLIVHPETGVEVPTGESGEIWVRSPGVVSGYWNDAAASADGIVAGYWRSGDIGRLDEQGYLYVLDRLKDMINRGGYKIYSAVVENVLLQIPGVQEAALVGRPDPVLGERVHAFVTTTRDDLDADAIRAFCSERLGDYEVPETVTVGTEPLPRNSAGKLAKLELRTRAAALPPFVKPSRS